MNEAKRQQIWEALFSRYQGARIELDHETTFQLLIAVLLSAQATDVGVNKATKALFEKVKEARDMVELTEEELIGYIRTIGLYRNKAKNVMLLSHILIDKYRGKVPKSRRALESLPGVGRKTANVVLNEAFGKPTIAVDTHIFRVCNRSGVAPGKTPDDVERRLLRYVPMKYKRPIHQWLIQLGRYTCVARKPKCQECPIYEWCEYPEKVHG